MGTEAAPSIDGLMESATGVSSVKQVEASMSDVAKIMRAALAKAADDATPHAEAVDVVRRANALSASVIAQIPEDGVEKTEGDAEPLFKVEEALMADLIADADGIDPHGTWTSDIERLRARFAAEKAKARKPEEEEEEGMKGKAAKPGEEEEEEGKAKTKKSAGLEDEDQAWAGVRDINAKPAADEDWGKDPAITDADLDEE